MTETIKQIRRSLKNDDEHSGFSQAELAYRNLLWKVLYCLDQQLIEGVVDFNSEFNGAVPIGDIIKSYQEWKEKNANRILP